MARSNFYKGNPALPKANVPRMMTEAQQAEFFKCAEDPVYFGETYFKIIGVDADDLIPFVMFPYQKRAVKLMYENRRMLMCASRQCGKDLHWDQPIGLFGGGFKTMEELEVGDQIIGSDGRATAVIYKTDPMYTPNYRITFDDKTYIDCGEGHLWTVKQRWNGHKTVTMSTKQLIDSVWRKKNTRGYHEYAYYIPNVSPVQYQSRDVSIDPYLLGAWLGDGTSAGPSFTCHRDEVTFFTQQGLQLREWKGKRRTNVFEGRIENLDTQGLRLYNLVNNKHIPDGYLYGDVATRVSVLQGIVDTDGHVNDRGMVELQLSDRYPSLLQDIEQLVTSLGIKVTKKLFQSERYSSTRLMFTVDLDDFDVCRMPRKLQRQKRNLRRKRYVYSRTIQSIEEIETKRSYCIQVDAEDKLFTVGKQYQLTHNTTVATVILLHTALFNRQHLIGVLANKASTAREILKRVKRAFENLPDFLKSGVVEWNKSRVEFENGSIITADATKGESIRGNTLHLLYIDELAFVDNWEDFSSAVLPTISSGKRTKIIFTSTPNGLNHFYDYYEEAKKGINDFALVEVPWQEVPGRDETWRLQALNDLGNNEAKFAQEYALEFQGSSGTLIDGPTLKRLTAKQPIAEGQGVRTYEYAVAKQGYVVVVDTSRGKGRDYSAFSVINITEKPYRQVCTYYDNQTNAVDYAAIVDRVARYYNNAAILVELNDLGSQVSDLLFLTHENEEIISTATVRNRTEITSGFGQNQRRGLQTTTRTRNLGCSLLKPIVEQNMLTIVDENTISELRTFSLKGTKYEAEQGKHDDLVMGLVFFAWMTGQQYFQNLTDRFLSEDMREHTDDQIDDIMSMFRKVMKENELPEEKSTVVVDLSSGDFDHWLVS